MSSFDPDDLPPASSQDWRADVQRGRARAQPSADGQTAESQALLRILQTLSNVLRVVYTTGAERLIRRANGLDQASIPIPTGLAFAGHTSDRPRGYCPSNSSILRAASGASLPRLLFSITRVSPLSRAPAIRLALAIICKSSGSEYL